MYRIIYYRTERGDGSVYEFLEKLDIKSRAKVMAHIELLEKFGPYLKRPYADHVRGKIRELRVQMGSDRFRVLHFFHVQNQIVLVHAFIKKTQKLREKDIDLAERRMADWTTRYPNGA